MNQSRLAKSVFGAAGGLITLLVGFVSSILIARFLGPQANGLISYALWLSTVGAILAEAGTGLSMLHVLPSLAAAGQNAARRKQFAAFLLIPVAIFSLVLLALFMAVSRFTDVAAALKGETGLLALTAALFLFQSVGALSRLYLVGDQRIRTFFLSSLVSSLLQLGGIFAGLQYGAAGVLVGYCAGQALNFLTSLWLMARRPSDCGVSRRELLQASSLNFFDTAIASIFLARPEIFLLEKMDTLENVGLYAVALTLLNMTLQIPVQFSGNLVTFYAQQKETGGDAAVTSLFIANLRYFSFLTLPTCFGLAAIAPQFVQLIFGPEFATAGPVIVIMALSAPLAVFLHLGNQYAFSVKRYGFRLGVTLFGGLAMVVGGLLVIPLGGILGAAFLRAGVAALLVIVYVTGLNLWRPLLRIALPVGNIATSAALCGLAAFAISSAFPGWPGLGLAIGAGAIIFLLSLRLTRAVTGEDLAHLDPIILRFPSWVRRIVRALVV